MAQAETLEHFAERERETHAHTVLRVVSASVVVHPVRVRRETDRCRDRQVQGKRQTVKARVRGDWRRDDWRSAPLSCMLAAVLGVYV